MSLKFRILLLTTIIFIVSALAAGFATHSLTERVIAEWGERFAQQQVRYHKSKALQPILRELALAKQLARSLIIRDWAQEPNNETKRRLALRELESFRQSFQEQNFFVALAENGQYFYNNAQNEFAGRELRYSLNPALSKDQWFYTLLRRSDEVQINVEPDAKLGVTNVWINVQIRDDSGRQVLGVAGTGLNLDYFINDMEDSNAEGVSSLLVDDTGSIQLHRNKALIDYASLTKPIAERQTLFSLLDTPSDQDSVREAMNQLRGHPQTTTTRYVHFAGKRYLIGMTALPEIGWFEITLLDLNELLPIQRFADIALVFLISLLAALIVLTIALNRLVLTPLGRLRTAMSQVASGNTTPIQLLQSGSGELRDVMAHFPR